jgi:2'-5' RNA ligase
VPAPSSPAVRAPIPIRGFVAVNFSSTLRLTLADVVAQLVKAAPPAAVKWVEAETIHLTLKFLGDIPASGVQTIAGALTGPVSALPAFEFTAQGLGCFPNARRPRVVWVGIDDAGGKKMKTLQSAVEAALNPLGYPPEDRPFSAHITLGRVRREAAPRDAARVGEMITAQPAARWGVEKVEAIHLMKSELRRSGPVYTPLSAARLSSAL